MLPARKKHALGVLVLGLSIAGAAHAGPTPASTKDTARRLAREGLELMHAQKWAEARARLSRAYELVPAPTVAVLEAQALEKLGDLVGAAERYQAAVDTAAAPRSPTAFRRAGKDAQDELDRLVQRIPRLTIRVEGTSSATAVSQVRLDGAVLDPATLGSEMRVNPGDHVVSATFDGEETSESVTLAERENRSVTLQAPPDAPGREPPPPRSSEPPGAPESTAPPSSTAGTRTTLGFVSLGIGAAGLAVGGVFGVIMLDAKSSLDRTCTPLCPPSAEDDLSRFRTARTVSAIGYAAGLAGAAVGVVLLLTDTDASPAREHTAIWSDGRTHGLRGHF